MAQNRVDFFGPGLRRARGSGGVPQNFKSLSPGSSRSLPLMVSLGGRRKIFVERVFEIKKVNCTVGLFLLLAGFRGPQGKFTGRSLR